jgi:serine/threonine protein kinase
MRDEGLGNIISNYFAADCPPEIASSYPKEVSSLGHLMYGMGILPDTLPSEDFKKFANILRRAIMNEETYTNPKNYTLIGTGNMSVVILDRENNTARKTSEDRSNELQILQKLDKANSPHIARLKNVSDNPYTIELEYINGSSLESILKKENKLDYGRVFRYGSDIIAGLIELQRARIFYHRDIRPANIMIDADNDRAIIIDLGIATTDRHAMPLNNRRYGGSNDLVSLGQVMYRMTTGEHLFAGSKTMEMTLHAGEIKDQRDRIYADATGKSLEEYLRKVDHDVQNERIKNIIKACLTADSSDYRKISKMFEK